MKKSTPAFLLHKNLLILFGFLICTGAIQAQVSITCPTDIEQNTDPGECGAIANYTPPVGTGSGTNITTTLITGPAPGTFVDAGTTEITYLVTNDEGDSDQCTFYLTVTDLEAPEFDCPPDIFVDADPSTCGAIVNFAIPDVTDNCGVFSVNQSGGLPPGSNFSIGEHYLDFTAYDFESNIAFCRVILNVLDVTPPEITCPEDITVNASATCDAVVNYTAPVGTDGCSLTTTTLTSGIGSGGTFPLGINTETYTVTDAHGNETTCSFNVIVVDNTPPVITCPDNVVVNIGATGCSAIATYDMPTATDNCGNVTIVQTQGLPSGSVFPSGYNTQKFSATDEAGNVSVCQFTIFIQETVAPVITCPADIVVPTDPGECTAVVDYPAVVSTDNCLDANTDMIAGLASGSSFPLGTTTITYEVRDNSGNASMCTFTVTVVDSEDPVFDCADINVTTDPGSCTAVVNFSAPSVTDNCTLSSVLQTSGPASGSIFNVGSTPVEFTATDNAGNTTVCTINIIVTDNEAPEITCPGDINITIADDECTTLITYADPVVTDNCGGETFTLISGPASGDIVSAGTHTVTFEAEDAQGNTSTCSFDIIIAETEDPVFVDCPGDLIFPTDPNLGCEGIAIFDTPTADDCSSVNVVQTGGLPSGDVFPAGINTVEFTATDVFGNTAVCTFNIIIQPADPITITCPDNMVVSTDAGLCEAIVNFDAPTSNDSCGIATIVQTGGLVSGDSFPEGETIISFEITDLAGNTETCSFTVTVVDEEAPEITCADNIVVNIPDGDCETIVTYDLPIATDNCNLISVDLTSGLASGESFPVGVNTVTYTATDAANNTTTCSFTVTVLEAVPPTITCPDDIVMNNDAGICGAIVNYTAPVGVDDCGGAVTTLTSGLAPGSEFPVGTTVVTYTVTDISGNQTACSFSVTVNDTESPVFDCPENITLNSAAEMCGAIYNFTLPTATDNCTNALTVTQTAGPITGSTLALGETTFEFTTQDDGGNTATCSYTVTVVDDTAPIFSNCPSDSTLYLSPGSCTIIANYETPVASDNCSVTISKTSGPANGASLGIGTYTYEITATDNAGNSSICAFTYTVVDTIAPIITCPSDLTTCESVPTFDIPTATDNCQVESIIQIEGLPLGSTFPEGDNILTFVATDNSGNTDTCSFTITVLLNAPDAFAGDDITLCDETSTTLSGNDPEGSAVEWVLIEGSGNIANPNNAETAITALGEGTNRFVYTLDPENGCEVKSDTITVFVEIGVSVTASADKLIMYGSSTNISATPSPQGGTFSWNPPVGLSCTDCENPIAAPNETTHYYVTYTSPAGCAAMDSVLIRVFRELPNTITPDGDNVNDVWNIPEIEHYPNAHVVIYNRWGNSIFESSGHYEPWDGTFEGKELPAGSYYYILDFKTPGMDNLNGTVNIIR